MRPSTGSVFLFSSTQKLRMFFLAAAIIAAGCAADLARASESQRLTPERATAVDRAVHEFMRTVAQSVTQDGPTAWLKYFDSGPAFFMAVNGQMAFPNAAAAQEGTRKFAQTVPHIELKWGDDLRIDPLTAELAIVAASWHETMVDVGGHRIDQSGYLTGLAEYREGRWQFRDLHWSSPVPTSP